MLRRRQNNRIAECRNNGWLKLILFDSKREILWMVEQGEEGATLRARRRRHLVAGIVVFVKK